MKTFIYPISGTFPNMIKICKYFDELDDFKVLMTGQWGISAIISWSDKSINYPTVADMIFEVLHGSETA